MRRHHFGSDPADVFNRRGQLIAAAEALVEWVHERQAAWAEDPLPDVPAAVEEQAFDQTTNARPPIAASSPRPIPASTRIEPPHAAAEPSVFEGPEVAVPPRVPAAPPEPPPYFEPANTPPPPTYFEPANTPPPPYFEPANAPPPAYFEPAGASTAAPASFDPTPPPGTPPRFFDPAPAAFTPAEPAPAAFEPFTLPPPIDKPPFGAPIAPPALATASYGSGGGVMEAIPAPIPSDAATEDDETEEPGWQFPTHLIAPIARWSARGGIALAIVGIVVAAGWRARTYVANYKPAPKIGTAILETLPPDSEVLVDGKPAGKTPLETELTAGRHSVEFRRKNAARKMDIEVIAGKFTTTTLDWSAKPTGFLSVESDPAGARVTIDGKLRGTTPITLDDLTVGAHTVVLDSDKGTVRRSVTISTERNAEVSEAIFAGWLKVFAPFEVKISEGTRVLRLDDQSQVMLPPGPHDLRFVNADLGYAETRRVEIDPGKTASLSLVPPSSTLTVTSSVPAEVLIDGQSAGQTPIARSIQLGTREVVVRSTAGERRFTITVTPKPVRLDVDFSHP